LLADPRPENARNLLLQTVQHAEPYLPTRLAVPEEAAAEYFELPSGGSACVRFAKLFVPATEKLKQFAPSAIRPDGSAWPQIVRAADDPAFHKLLIEFGKATGAPLLLHDTFSLRGSPIVRVEGDAHDAFQRSSLDCLVVEDRVYERAEAR
jgi:carbamoyltransferase